MEIINKFVFHQYASIITEAEKDVEFSVIINFNWQIILFLVFSLVYRLLKGVNRGDEVHFPCVINIDRLIRKDKVGEFKA